LLLILIGTSQTISLKVFLFKKQAYRTEAKGNGVNETLDNILKVLITLTFTTAMGSVHYDERKLRTAEQVVQNLKSAFAVMINKGIIDRDCTVKKAMAKRVTDCQCYKMFRKFPIVVLNNIVEEYQVQF